MSNGSTTTELDSHADTCCFGKHCYVLGIEESEGAVVNGFMTELGEITVPIANVAVAYDDAQTDTTYILIFNQVLYIKEMSHNLVSPLQMRMNEVIVNDIPLCTLVMQHDLTDISADAHSLVVNDPYLHVPFRMNGTTSYFITRKPTANEIADDYLYPKIVMTYTAPRWDPHDPTFSHNEDKLRDELSKQGNVSRNHRRRIESVTSTYLTAQKYEDTVMISKVDTARRKGTVSAEQLARRWHISLESATRTIDCTTQKGVRDFAHMAGTRRLRHLTQQLAYRPLNAICYTDTMISTVPSLSNKFTCAQIYVTDFEWTKVYPMRTKSEAPDTLDLLHHQYGAFRVMIPDNAKELTSKSFRDKLRRAGTVLQPIEAYTPNQNRAESAIRELKRMYRRAMLQSKAPECLWDHCFQLMAEIRSHMSLNLMNLEGETPTTRLLGDTPDISHLCQFEWYEYVWWLDPTDKLQNKKLGRYLGPSLTSGDIMCSKVLTSKATIRVHSSVFPLSAEDRHSDVVTEKLKEFDLELAEKLGDRIRGVAANDDDLNGPDERDFVTPEHDEQNDMLTGEPLGMPEADEFDHDAYDKYISARVWLPDSEGVLHHATVKSRKRDDEGNLIGHSNANPILDTSLYIVEFDDGTSGTYTANIVAENIFEQVDAEGQVYTLFDSVIDHKKTADAITETTTVTDRNGKEQPIRTTKGWKLCVQWKDGSTSWLPLKDLKESHPIQVAEYAIAHKIAHEPAFAWWVNTVLRRRNRIIAAQKTRYARTNQKFGIELPHTVKRALEIDRETGTTFWIDAIKKEMGTTHPAFKFLAAGSPLPVGYQKIPIHMVFDIKMDFTRKARLVAGGHKTEPPASITYASVVARDSVRIAFLVAALNELDILAGDVQGAYLNAPCREKVYTICGPEFGEYQGRIAIIQLALYGLKSSGYAWRSHLAETLRMMDFTMCYADNDVWMRAAEKLDGTKYYEYVLVYTDDILVLSMRPHDVMSALDQHYVIKPNSIGPPTQYLGAQIGTFTFANEPEKSFWSMSSEKYVKEATRNVQNWLSARDMKALKTRAPSVFPSGYRPEVDASDLCNDELASYYQQQIGVLRWAVELGRINICAEVSMLAAFSAAPRIGHFNAMLHIFAFLAHHPRSRLVFDSTFVPDLNDGPDQDWQEFYPGVEEEIPVNAPKALGKSVQMICFVDSDHAGDLLTRRSRTGVLIYLNRSPILWYSKKQSCIETSTFGSEFMGLKIATDLVKGLRYKLRMMGIPIDGPTHMRVDNMSVVHNSTVPESVLKKKSNSIAYHYVRENVAARVLKIGYESSETNIADMLTKIQAGPVRKRLSDMVLF